MSEDYNYRPKFKDIRVRPSAADKSRARAQKNKVCEHPSCDLEGEHRAPKRNTNETGFHWFCQRHAAEYNRSWNFFDNMTEDQQAEFNESAAYGHRKTWKFGTGPVGTKGKLRSGDPRLWAGMGEFGPDVSKIKTAGQPSAKSSRTRLQVRALADLDLPSQATPHDIRERYSEYVKRFHPDSNGGDRSSEHKLARVIRAFKTLKAAGLTQDD